MMHDKNAFGLAWAAYAVGVVLLALGATGALIYVASHFLAKVW